MKAGESGKGLGVLIQGNVPTDGSTQSELEVSEHSSPEDPPAKLPYKRSRRPVTTILSILRRLWIPLVVLVVLAAGGFTVFRIHGIFGSEARPSYGNANPGGGAERATSSQLMRYEVFGPAGTVALISYFDGNGDVNYARGVRLPW